MWTQQGLNLRPSGYEPDALTEIQVKIRQKNLSCDLKTT